MSGLADFGLWTRRLIAIILVALFCYMATMAEAIPNSVENIVLIVVSFYFAKEK